MKNIRTVIWDCDNVMWFHRSDEPWKIANALKIENIKELEIEFFDMIKFFNTYFMYRRAKLSQMYKIVEEKMPILYFNGISANKFMEVWQELKFDINEFNKDVLVVMKHTKQKGIKNIVKTDWWRQWQEVLLKQYGVLDYIEKLYCCDNKYLKCNPLSAQEIIDKYHESEFVIIGDSLTSDIAFAKHAGIKSIWFNRDGKQKNNSQYNPDFEVASLLEVMEII